LFHVDLNLAAAAAIDCLLPRIHKPCLQFRSIVDHTSFTQVLLSLEKHASRSVSIGLFELGVRSNFARIEVLRALDHYYVRNATGLESVKFGLSGEVSLQNPRGEISTQSWEWYCNCLGAALCHNYGILKLDICGRFDLNLSALISVLAKAPNSLSLSSCLWPRGNALVGMHEPCTTMCNSRVEELQIAGLMFPGDSFACLLEKLSSLPHLKSLRLERNEEVGCNPNRLSGAFGSLFRQEKLKKLALGMKDNSLDPLAFLEGLAKNGSVSSLFVGNVKCFEPHGKEIQGVLRDFQSRNVTLKTFVYDEFFDATPTPHWVCLLEYITCAYYRGCGRGMVLHSDTTVRDVVGFIDIDCKEPWGRLSSEDKGNNDALVTSVRCDLLRPAFVATSSDKCRRFGTLTAPRPRL
jgi:hypothetical protein